MKLIPSLLCDFYKVGHKQQYPEGTTEVYSTWTPRSNRHLPKVKEMSHVGVQGFIKEFLIDYFNEHFFGRDRQEVVTEYERYLTFCLGVQNPDSTHIAALHKLGYLPIEIKSLPEGTSVPMRVASLTIRNTLPEFFWVTNYLETLMSNNLWKPATTASIAKQYKKILNEYAMKTVGNTDFTPFQGHDFSMRGMSGVEDSARSGFGHLAAGFVGTDTIPSIMYAEQYYGADIEKELVGCSVNATEHSVMSGGGKDTEEETYRRLIEDVYPTGIVSIVSDTWDLWKVVTKTLPKLKDKILSRDGGEGSIDKVVIRPDSGDPVDIICGTNPNGTTPAEKGLIRCLYEVFGGTKNDKGFIELNPKIGAIYGDSITLERCEAICKGLADQGFASTNVVFGIGSYTYQHLTRDSLGFAMKATSIIVNGEQRDIFKDPVTDDGTKKSAKGKVAVVQEDGILTMKDQQKQDNKDCLLETVFVNGKLIKETTLAEIRDRIKSDS